MARELRTQLVSVHWFRRTARGRENKLEGLLGTKRTAQASQARFAAAEDLERAGVPAWATGVRVQRYRGSLRGRWQVQATAPAL